MSAAEDCKSLHPSSILGQASTVYEGKAPPPPTPRRNETEPDGSVRDQQSRPNPELGSANVPVIGFTGSRDGMSEARLDDLKAAMSAASDWGRFVFHHGDCVGSDAQAHAVARELGAWIVAHPAYPIAHPMRANCAADVVMPISAPLKRNAVIVAAADKMIAAPAGPEVQRSGTWTTVRMARRSHRLIHFV
jgi:hypothetical protein